MSFRFSEPPTVGPFNDALRPDYVGQVSINSVPRVTNTAWIVAISILIAMLAVSLGLFLLFVVLRPKLEHRWYKRLGVAMILGVGVCLMHFGKLPRQRPLKSVS